LGGQFALQDKVPSGFTTPGEIAGVAGLLGGWLTGAMIVVHSEASETLQFMCGSHALEVSLMPSPFAQLLLVQA